MNLCLSNGNLLSLFAYSYIVLLYGIKLIISHGHGTVQNFGTIIELYVQYLHTY